MASVLDLVKHYQHSIEKYANDEQKVLKCIDKLFNLDVTVQHLQETGVGRTVNALRKEPGDIGQAARALVYKWKLMVAAEESDQEDHNDSVSNTDYNHGHDSDYNTERKSVKLEDKYHNTNQRENTSYEKHNGSYSSSHKRKCASSEEEEPENKKSKHSRENGYVVKKEIQIKKEPSDSEDNSQDDYSSGSESESSESQSSDDDKKDNIKIKSEKDIKQEHSSKAKYSSHTENERHKYEKQREDKYAKHNSSKHSYEKMSQEKSHSSSKYNSSSSSDYKSEKKERQSRMSEKENQSTTKEYESSQKEHRSSEKHHRSSEKEHRSSEKEKRTSENEHKSSERDHKEYRSSEKGHRSSEKEHRTSEKGRSSEKEHRSIEKDHKSSKEKSEGKVKESPNKPNSSSDKHKSSSSDKHKSSSSDKHKSSSSSDKHKSKDSNGHKSSEKSLSKSEKHVSSKDEKSKVSSVKEISSHKHKSSSKDKHSSPSSEKSKDLVGSSKEKEHKSNKKHSSQDTKSHSKDSSEKSEEKSNKTSKHSTSKSSKSKEDTPKKKPETNCGDSDDGIDCGSGASFAEALGMGLPSKSKKKTSSIKESSPTKGISNDMSPAALLSPSAKLAPLPAIEISALPEISPNYRPRPPPKFLPHFSDEDAMNVVISSKNQRTKVYSGNKTYGKIPTLYEMCVQILQEHIDALEYTGGVPYEILKPVIDKATPQQLFMLEHYNPYLMEDTDHLWKKFCDKSFRNKKREEMETWREMYIRCQEEQEIRLKSLTANIRMTQEAKKAPIKQTKMAYVDTVVKPPRNIAKKQAQHGTAFAATASPAARVASLATAPNVLRTGRPTPVPTLTSSSFKPKKAPLMQKALQFMRGRKR